MAQETESVDPRNDRENPDVNISPSEVDGNDDNNRDQESGDPGRTPGKAEGDDDSSATA
jgi:hypothetical protein